MAKDKKQISRVTRSKEEAKSSYDKMSRYYDTLSGRFEKKYRDIGLYMLDAKVGEKVLEIGFGTGHCLLALARAVGDAGKVYGIDISEGMCKIARSRIDEAGLSHRVELECGDAANLPYKKNYFDAIFMSFTLELFDTPEIPGVLDECRRTLKTNGRIGIVSMAKGKKTTFMIRAYEWTHNKFPNYVDCRPIYVKEMIAEAGFNQLEVKEMLMWGLPVEIVRGYNSYIDR